MILQAVTHNHFGGDINHDRLKNKKNMAQVSSFCLVLLVLLIELNIWMHLIQR